MGRAVAANGILPLDNRRRYVIIKTEKVLVGKRLTFTGSHLFRARRRKQATVSVES